MHSHSDAHYTSLQNKPYKRPCKLCGAVRRDANGHDPCISNLPGVLHACCGHGDDDAYVMFENAVIIRGRFEFRNREELLKIQQEWFPTLLTDSVEDTHK